MAGFLKPLHDFSVFVERPPIRWSFLFDAITHYSTQMMITYDRKRKF